MKRFVPEILGAIMGVMAVMGGCYAVMVTTHEPKLEMQEVTCRTINDAPRTMWATL